jgi:hypothetical protein
MIDGNSDQPSTEFRVPTKTVETAIRANKSLLNHFFGIRRVKNDPQSDLIDLPLIGLYSSRKPPSSPWTTLSINCVSNDEEPPRMPGIGSIRFSSVFRASDMVVQFQISI